MSRGFLFGRARIGRGTVSGAVVLILLAALTTALLSAVPGVAGPQAGPVARTAAGSVRGTSTHDVAHYRGVPYAAPPVGTRRWRPPQPARPWSGVRSATRSGPACAQGAGMPDASEDCLYLDVTVPHPERTGHRPVMVWLHGGGLSEGVGSDYDPTRLAVQGDVVVVTVDFRLGIFGFFGHAGLPGSGTFGLADQQAALRWVRQNIAAFGGDRHNVTLFGQSGGAVATCAQLTSPSSAGLFDKAILESASCDFGWTKSALTPGGAAGSFFHPVADVRQRGATAAGELKCDRSSDRAELDCLRKLDTHQFDDQDPEFAAAATGTPLLPLPPDQALRLGAFHRVPVISGSTHDEHRLTAGILELATIPITAEQYPGLLKESFGDDAPAVLRRYPLSRYGGNAALAWSAVFTDRIWVCTQDQAASAMSRRVPTYSYEFADEHALPFVDLPADFDPGASHGSELPSLFDLAGRPTIGGDRYTDDQRRLAGTMIGYWTTFARTGNPNRAGLPTWPRAVPGAADSRALRLAPGKGGIAPVDAYAEHQCAAWHVGTDLP
ncbi:MAG: carboxylesterase family protein [Actinocatenispora sp.]